MVCCHVRVSLMRRVLVAIALLLLSVSARAQPADFTANGDSFGAVFLKSLPAKNIVLGQTLSFGQQYWPLITGGNYNLPACDKPLPGSTAQNPQADMVVGDASGVAGTTNITL